MKDKLLSTLYMIEISNIKIILVQKDTYNSIAPFSLLCYFPRDVQNITRTKQSVKWKTSLKRFQYQTLLIFWTKYCALEARQTFVSSKSVITRQWISFALKTVKIKTLHNFSWLSLSETKVNIGLEKGPESLIEIEHSLSQSGQAIYSLRPSTLAQWQYGYDCSSRTPC